MASFFCRGCLLPESDKKFTSLFIEDQKLSGRFEKIAGFSIAGDQDQRDALVCDTCMKKLLDCFEFLEKLQRYEKVFFSPKRQQGAKVQDGIDGEAGADLKSEIEEGKYEITETTSDGSTSVVNVEKVTVTSRIGGDDGEFELKSEAIKEDYEMEGEAINKFKDDLNVGIMKSFECDRCGLSFSRKQELEEHLNLHLDSQTKQRGTSNSSRQIRKTEMVRVVEEEAELKSEIEEGKYEITETTRNSCDGTSAADVNVEDSERRDENDELEVKSEVIEDYEMKEASERTNIEASNEQVSVQESSSRVNKELEDQVSNLSPLQELQVRLERLSYIPKNVESVKNKVLETESSSRKKRPRKRRIEFEKYVIKETSENVFKCSICEKVYKFKSCLFDHIQSAHEKIRYECQICRLKLTTKSNLNSHIERVHEKIKKFECDRCGVKFYHKHYLKIHIKAHIKNPKFAYKPTDTSNPNRPFKCEAPNCGKFFNYKSVLKKHILTHSDARPFHCSKCDKRFKRENYFREHQKTCGTKVSNKSKDDLSDEISNKNGANSLIKKLMRGRSKEFTGKTFKCEICGLKFSQRNDLKNHLDVVHLKLKSFDCDRCG